MKFYGIRFHVELTTEGLGIMLEGLLEKKTCAECKVCCVYDNYDIWETPYFTPESAEKLMNINPDVRMKKKDKCYTFRIDPLIGDELFVCPALDTKSGCMLGDDKPFECKIWPYRIMSLDGERVIAISPVCENINAKPLSEIVKFLKDGLAEEIFRYADKHPEIVKEYDSSYPILLFENRR